MDDDIRTQLAKASGSFWLKSRSDNPSAADYAFADLILECLIRNGVVLPPYGIQKLMQTEPPWADAKDSRHGG